MKAEKFRLIINGAFCVSIIAIFLPMLIAGLLKLFDSEPYPPSWDDDQIGAAKIALAAYLAGGIFALIGLVSLLRTVKKWRLLVKNEHSNQEEVQ